MRRVRTHQGGAGTGWTAAARTEFNFEHLSRNKSRSPAYVVVQGTGRTPMVRKKIKFPSADVMGGLYLGVAVTGVEALVAMGLVIAFM